MFKLNNYLTLIILLITLLLAIVSKSFDSLSTSLETILPNSEQKELLKEVNKFSSNKKLFIAVEGFDKKSLEKIKSLEKELSKLNYLSLDKYIKNENLEEFKNSYFIYLNDIKKDKSKYINVKKELEQIRQKLISSDFTYIFEKNDPLEIVEDKKIDFKEFIKNRHLILKDYGYLSIFSISSKINSLDLYDQVYDEVKEKIKDENIKVFSPIFYFTENSRIIKKDVNKLIIISTIFLIGLYILILKNVKLLFNTINTLIASILFALFTSSLFFEDISIFVLVFGISISTVAIDYMFHNYTHDFYHTKKSELNKDVFLGMFTTVIAFFIFSFTSFELIKQLCYFSISSLLFSYIVFTFVFRKVDLKKRESGFIIEFSFFKKIKPLVVLSFSIILIVLAFLNIKLDFDLKNLDVNNNSLKNSEQFFFSRLKKDNTMRVMITGSSIDELIYNGKILKDKIKGTYIPISELIDKKSFEDKKRYLSMLGLHNIKNELILYSKELGFKEDTFKKTYEIDVTIPSYDIDKVKDFGIEISIFKEKYITYALLPKENFLTLEEYDFVELLSIKFLFEKELKNIFEELYLFGVLSITFILIALYIFTKKSYLLALSFLVFPIAIMLLLSFFVEINILHLFMIFIILAISIDFGIYMSSKNVDKNSYEAITYSLLSTFAGFGILIFSNISSLFSIGLISTLGILSIIVLMNLVKKGI